MTLNPQEKIKRYNQYLPAIPGMFEETNGKYILYSDHIKQKEKEMRTSIEMVERSLHEAENSVMYLISDIQKLNTQSENRIVLLKSITDSLSALKIQLEHDYHQMDVEEKLKLEQEED